MSPERTDQLTLSDEQESIKQQILERIRGGNEQVTTLGGYAGTGKSVLVGHFAAELGFAVCAYTGKATNVLRRRGVSASTIHSLIYEYEHEDSKGQPFFRKKDKDEVLTRGFIVDEASMVGREIYQDLLSFKRPILFVGDHGQLAPVGPDAYLMKSPDYVLETIHRNAGEIAYFAEWLRKGKPLLRTDRQAKEVRVARLEELPDETVLQVDQIICGYNRTRVELNAIARELRGYRAPLVLGERVMCLRNDRVRGLFNGQQGEVVAIHPGQPVSIDFQVDTHVIHRVPINPDTLGDETPSKRYEYGGPVPFAYAYVVTCHKAQGDEWGKVLVVEQPFPRGEEARWSYTAASRAKESLIWTTNR